MKRNKPLDKRHRVGTQTWRRRSYWSDQRSTGDWTVIVPQAHVGADARILNLSGAVTDGAENVAGDPTVGPNLYRWRLDLFGRATPVYAVRGPWYAWTGHSGRFGAVPRTGDVWYAFTSEGKCERTNCPRTTYFYEGVDGRIARHVPGGCPLGIPLDAGWKYAGRITL